MADADAPKKRGRPRIHASDAARKADFLEGRARLEVTINDTSAQALRGHAEALDVSLNQVLVSCIRYALTNHNWKTGLPWKR